MAPSEMIAWECGACTFTNEDCTRRSCIMCATERPDQYFIAAGASESASASTTTVNCREQARLAACSGDAPASDDAPVAKGVALPPVLGAAVAQPCRHDLSLSRREQERIRRERREQQRLAAMSEAPADFIEEPIAEGPPVLGVRPEVPCLGGKVPRRVMVERLVGTLVDVVRTAANNGGRTCPRHSCCGMQVS
jgi:hypothetical protein